jgi:hypothetical protein
VSHHIEGFKVPGLWLLILPPQAQPQATIVGKPSAGPRCGREANQ